MSHGLRFEIERVEAATIGGHIACPLRPTADPDIRDAVERSGDGRRHSWRGTCTEIQDQPVATGPEGGSLRTGDSKPKQLRRYHPTHRDRNRCAVLAISGRGGNRTLIGIVEDEIRRE